jgi:hypothetical protein
MSSFLTSSVSPGVRLAVGNESSSLGVGLSGLALLEDEEHAQRKSEWHRTAAASGIRILVGVTDPRPLPLGDADKRGNVPRIENDLTFRLGRT